MASKLEITAITLASLTGLWGVYFVLFIFAVWSTFRTNNASSKRLRVVIVLLFLDLLAHFIARSLEFSRARVDPEPENEIYKWGIPLTVIGNVTTSLAGLLSDGVVAWRFYVIYDRRKWALYVPAAAVIINACLCLSADMQHLAIYHEYNFYENTLLDVTLNITIAWGWFMFAVNTLLTASIAGKILYVNRQNKNATGWTTGPSPYATVVKAVIESGLVTWIGLLVYEISSLAPAGHVTSNYDIGYVMLCIIPIFFGISQCLIIVRLGFAREARPAAARTNTSKLGSYESALASSQSAETTGTGATLAYPVGLKLAHDVEMGSIPSTDIHDKEYTADVRGGGGY